MESTTLRAGGAGLVLAPAVGGAITRYWLECLVIYSPPGQPFFCAEPVSHTTDAINLAAAGRTDTGLLVLEPGQTVRAAVTLTPERGRGEVE